MGAGRRLRRGHRRLSVSGPALNVAKKWRARRTDRAEPSKKQRVTRT
jgi:hypothetical protein